MQKNLIPFFIVLLSVFGLLLLKKSHLDSGNIILFGSLLLVFILIPLRFFIYFRLLCNEFRNPNAITDNIQNLYKAILNKNKQEAYDSFYSLASLIKQSGFFNARYDIFKSFAGQAIKVNWARLKEVFLDMLEIYKTFDTNKRIITSDKIDQMIIDIKSCDN